MGWAILSCCVALGLVLESRRRLLAVRALWDVAAPFLEAQPPGAAPHVEPRARVAALNEATVEIGSGLAQARLVPSRCAKAALSFGALVALLESAQLVRGDGSRAWLGPVLSLVGGGVGALGCSLLGRAAEAEARRLRADWATLIQRSARDVATTGRGSNLKSGFRRDDSAPA